MKPALRYVSMCHILCYKSARVSIDLTGQFRTTELHKQTRTVVGRDVGVTASKQRWARSALPVRP